MTKHDRGTEYRAIARRPIPRYDGGDGHTLGDWILHGVFSSLDEAERALSGARANGDETKIVTATVSDGIASYKVTWSHTSQVERCDTYDEAVAIVLAVHPGAAIGHDGDIASGGERTMAWSDEESTDDGTRAVASIWVQHAGEVQ